MLIVYLKTFKLGDGAKKYLANASWLFLEQMARMLIGLFVSVWIIRYLGPDRYGSTQLRSEFGGVVRRGGLPWALIRSLFANWCAKNIRPVL